VAEGHAGRHPVRVIEELARRHRRRQLTIAAGLLLTAGLLFGAALFFGSHPVDLDGDGVLVLTFFAMSVFFTTASIASVASAFARSRTRVGRHAGV